MCHKLFSVCALLSYTKNRDKIFSSLMINLLLFIGNLRYHCDECHKKLILGAAWAWEDLH